ncbi:hypothetical protein NDU88_003075 [Pleurodeles waltl]|uniref:Uncharacterized protein n=1 Tax=Pleurodeles waltl TaxID=8319 RepID=A0AAV7M4B7_PLEWA|nr:hypothetical protein NDU88_003075 [Pleurodeles waltl]
MSATRTPFSHPKSLATASGVVASHEEGDYSLNVNTGNDDASLTNLIREEPSPGIVSRIPLKRCGVSPLMISDGVSPADDMGGQRRYHLRPRPVASTRLKDFVLP